MTLDDGPRRRLTLCGRLPRLEVVCLGAATARLEGGEAPADVVWRRHLALLVYLALSPDLTRSRDHLVGLLWPEKPEARARHALNEALLRLRRSLGAARLQSRADAVTLCAAGLDVDALSFAAWADRDPARAVALLRGDFLEGFALDEARPFEDWVAGERQRQRWPGPRWPRGRRARRGARSRRRNALRVARSTCSVPCSTPCARSSTNRANRRNAGYVGGVSE